jgi:multiple sugar transport system ATP-binding protein
MAQLTLDEVTKTFQDDDGEIIAVDQVSVDIQDGEFLCVVGPSGCGKSTTLRMIAGLEDISSGEIRLDGQIINDQPPARRNVAMVFQSYALYPHMTVRENMAFGLEESTEMPDDEINERVEQACKDMGIFELIDRKPGELSGGQQQRVALGRAIVRDPEVFLMDEPLSNLDAKLRAQMRTELQQLQNRFDVTTVYVTHNQTEAMTMSDRIAVLNEGTLQQVGEPLELYHAPENRFVAGFIGEPSMNFVETTAEDDDLVDGEFRYPLPAETAAEVTDGRAVTLGIRPEDVAVGGSVDADPERTFEGTVDVVEPMGNENVVHLTLSAGPSLVATVDGLRQVRGDESVAVGLPAEAIHLFDADSGAALHNRSLEDADLESPRLS